MEKTLKKVMAILGLIFVVVMIIAILVAPRTKHITISTYNGEVITEYDTTESWLGRTVTTIK